MAEPLDRRVGEQLDSICSDLASLLHSAELWRRQWVQGPGPEPGCLEEACTALGDARRHLRRVIDNMDTVRGALGLGTPPLLV